MAAATAVFQALEPGDHVVAPKVMYWALRNWLTTHAARWGLAVDLVAMDDLDALKRALRPGRTKLVWTETPANPLWTITDIAAAADIAHAAGARLAVDSTAASPIHTRPLALGADIVMHSASKILNGHSDVIAGALAGAAADPFWQRIAAVRSGQGGIIGPLEAYLLLRGLRTLHVRAAAQAASAAALARRLAAHRNVAGVLYPGLPEHPGHGVAARQMENGFGFMLSIRAAGGERAAIRTAAAVEPVETGHVARRRREPDRASGLGRGAGHAVPARPPAAVHRPRSPRRSLRRPRQGSDRRPRCGYGGGVRHGVTTTSSKRGRGVSCSRRRLAAMMVPLISPPNRKMAARVYRKTSAAMAVARPPYIEA